MKITRFLFGSALLFGAVTFSVGAEEATLKEPVRVTHYIPGKALVRYKGCVVQVMCYTNGSPQFNFTKPDERFGGLAVSVDGKLVKGTRRDEGKIIHYDFPGGGILTMQIMPDKRVSFEGKFPGAQKLYLEVPMLAKFFSGSLVDIDGTVKTIPARQENPKVNYALLFKHETPIVCKNIPVIFLRVLLAPFVEISLFQSSGFEDVTDVNPRCIFPEIFRWNVACQFLDIHDYASSFSTASTVSTVRMKCLRSSGL